MEESLDAFLARKDSTLKKVLQMEARLTMIVSLALSQAKSGLQPLLNVNALQEKSRKRLFA